MRLRLRRIRLRHVTTAYDFTATDRGGTEHSLRDYKDRPLLIVNVASECGYAPQFKGLQKLWEEYGPDGLVVLGFPSDQFHQEPRSDDEIAEFCSVNFGVDFPLFAKVDVNGDSAHPLWQWLQNERPGVLGTSEIKWNFTKFLTDANGQVVGRFSPKQSPRSLRGEIEAVLKG